MCSIHAGNGFACFNPQVLQKVLNVSRNVTLTLNMLAIAFALVSAQAQTPSVEEIKAKVEEAYRTRDAANDAFAKENAEEGQKLNLRAAELFREARRDYEQINAAESSDTGLILDYVKLLNDMGDYDLSEKAMLRAAKIAPDDAAVWLLLGQTQAALGPASELFAIRSLRRATEIEPTSSATVDAYASLGALYQQAGLYEFSREAFTETLKLDPGHVGAKLTVASLNAREGKMAAAEEAFDSVESLSSDHGAYIRSTLGPALNAFEDSRRWLPDTAAEHFAYAKLLVRVDRLQDCIWPLGRAVKLDDQNYAAWNLYGSVYRSMNRNRGAREAFMRSLELNPDQPRTRQALDELDAMEAADPGSTTTPATGPADEPVPAEVPGLAPTGEQSPMPEAPADPAAAPQPAP